MTEKKYSNLWLYVSIALMVIVLVLIWVILLGRDNDNSDDFSNKQYCHSLYDKAYKAINDQINDHDYSLESYMTDFTLFYSSKKDSCIVWYHERANSTTDPYIFNTYIIKDYLSNDVILECNVDIMDDNEPSEYFIVGKGKNCVNAWREKLEDLK